MSSGSATCWMTSWREATRFLVVTHHPLTMARMDRLYGVTMQERGVSRLLSVECSGGGNGGAPADGGGIAPQLPHAVGMTSDARRWSE